jgi:DNA-binding NtrC family response regulator
MTAYGSYENKEKAIHTGALHYVEKPFEVSDLRKIVLEMLN